MRGFVRRELREIRLARAVGVGVFLTLGLTQLAQLVAGMLP